MGKEKWVSPPKFKNGVITVTTENEEQYGFEKGTMQHIQETFFGKTEDADFEVIPDEPEAPTLSRNLLDEAGLWGTDKKQNSLTNLKQDKTKEGEWIGYLK